MISHSLSCLRQIALISFLYLQQRVLTQCAYVCDVCVHVAMYNKTAVIPHLKFISCFLFLLLTISDAIK